MAEMCKISGMDAKRRQVLNVEVLRIFLMSSILAKGGLTQLNMLLNIQHRAHPQEHCSWWSTFFQHSPASHINEKWRNNCGHLDIFLRRGKLIINQGAIIAKSPKRMCSLPISHDFICDHPWCLILVKCDHETWTLDSHWSRVIRRPGNWLLIGRERSRDMDTGIFIGQDLRAITRPGYSLLIGQEWSHDLNTGFSLVNICEGCLMSRSIWDQGPEHTNILKMSNSARTNPLLPWC